MPGNKELYQKLYQQKTQIEADLGEQPEWMELPTKKASRIRLLRVGNLEDESKWEDYFKWLLNEAEMFHRVFPKYIRR